MESQYVTAKEEYLHETEDGRIKLVYAYFGLAIYFSQCLEETFATMLWTDGVFRNKVKTNKEVNDIIDEVENSKKTMGNLINDIKRIYVIDDDTAIRLSEVLSKRNYLAHRYFKVNVEMFYSEKGILEMIKYFCDFIDDIRSVDADLRVYYSGFLNKLGITEDKVQKIMEDMIDDARKS